MRVPSRVFPGTDLVQYLCDNPKCRKPITLNWRTREGEDCCSNRCRKILEERNSSVADEIVESKNTADAEPKKLKKKKKKAVAEVEAAPKKKKKKLKSRDAEEAPKKKKKKLSGPGHCRFDKEARITILRKENPYRGNRHKMHSCIKSGDTVADYLVAVQKKGFNSCTRALQRAIEDKLIKIA